MRSWKEFSAEHTSIMIMLSREGMSQNVVLPWDSNSDELISAFVKMLWVAGYPPSWFPEILKELAENIEIELKRNQENPVNNETDSQAG